MKEFDYILNDLITELFTKGKVEYSKEGLQVDANKSDNGLFVKIAYEDQPDESEKIVSDFESYIQGLDDDFFLEVAESFEDGKLKAIQNKLDSKNISEIKEGIKEFKDQVTKIATRDLDSITVDINDLEKDLKSLYELKNTYLDILNA